MKVSCSTIRFRIDIDFDGCEVDMVYREMAARRVPTPICPALTDAAQIPIDEKKLPKTPTEASVDFALNWLAGFVDRREMCTSSSKFYDLEKHQTHITELEEIGVTVESWYGLMMGTCHLVCEVDYEKFSPELVEKASKIVHGVFKKFVRYYKQKKQVAA